MKTEFSASKIMMFKYIKPLLFIFILPTLKGVINYLKDSNLSGIITLETLLLIAVIAFAIIKCISFKISVSDNYLTVSEGVFLKSKSEIEICDISCITVSVSPIDFVFRSAYIRINTEAGSNKKCDFEFRLKRENAFWLYNTVYKTESSLTVKYSFLRLLLSVAAYTSVVTGVIIGVPFINNAGKLLGYGIKDYLINELNAVSNKFGRYVPPVVNAITLSFIFFYLIAFIYSLIKYGGFRFNVGKNNVEISRGVITKIHTRFNKRAVNCLLTEQNFMLRLLKLYSIRLSIGGFGVGKGETSFMDPCCSRHNAHIFLNGFFPAVKEVNGNGVRRICPHEKTLFRFFIGPSWWYLGVLALLYAVTVFFPFVNEFIIFVAAFCTAVFIYYLTLRVFCFKNGYAVLNNVFCIRTVKGFKTAVLYCPKEKVGIVKIVRWPLDFKHKTCSVSVSVLNEHGDKAQALFVDFGQVKEKIYELYKVNV